MFYDPLAGDIINIVLLRLIKVNLSLFRTEFKAFLAKNCFKSEKFFPIITKNLDSTPRLSELDIV